MKNLFKILLLLLFPLGLMAQEENALFAPDGAEWWYRNTGSKFTYENSKVIGDTIINSISAKKIKMTKHFRVEDSYARDTSNTAIYYTYSTEDTVFVYNEWFEDFTPLYVYNVEEGDTLCLPMIPHPYVTNNYLDEYFESSYNPIAERDSFYCIIIDSIRLVEYDGEFLETFFTSPIIEHGSYEGIFAYPAYNFSDGVFPEEFVKYKGYAKSLGSLQVSLLPNPVLFFQHLDGNLNTQNLLYGVTLSCYQDGNLNINLKDYECDYIDTLSPPVSIIENEIIALSVLPNPMEDDLHIHITENFNQAHFRMYDYLGREVKVGELKNQESILDVKELPKGLYLLRIIVDGVESVKKVMKR